MNKTLLLSAALSASLLAGEYGFRDYLTDKKNEFISFDDKSTVYVNYAPAGGATVTYCIIQGGNLTKTITTDLGKEELKAVDPAALEPILKMSKEERIAKYAKGEEKMGLKYTDAFQETTMANRATGKVGIGGAFECKDPSGKVLFKAHQRNGVENLEVWVVEYKPEVVRDNVRFSAGLAHKESNFLSHTSYKGTSTEIKEKIAAKYPTYESYFDDWNNGFLNSNRKQKLGGNYRMLDSFTFSNKFWLSDSMGELTETQYFCEAKNGTFLKDGKNFRTFLKEFYLEGARPQDFTSSPFVGNYACVGTPEAFTMELKDKKGTDSLGFRLGYALIKKGADNVQVSSTPSATKMTAVSGGVQGNVSATEEQIIRQIASSKVPFGKLVGANVISGYYNGTDAQGCDMVSLQKTVANMPVNKARKDTYNYKVCNGQVIALGETGLPGVPRSKELDPIIAQVKTQCKAYGAFGTEYQGTIVSCRSLDQNHCNLEINIMKDGKLIDKRVERTCK